ncbi:hypothetical protein MPTK1_2g12270 [Marchantia polymorpha subsp. ruderalis]|uniref:Uncharacterized protein n=1 Tax=Marchantia polymorpha TaxID=3197 RepID=A0A2R6XB48_MARPO|nr:hypothetical protein MARPO_0026s0143 [Marchantia polymorpha]BBN02038.1 hypothetical protein Mp_2g12270 [Marchantia polymorpha subsp. ruderalis]|eukprot:PTQ43282.1 hypothetical protein MARPO_0026s0143 [Marchantia polymorpha]
MRTMRPRNEHLVQELTSPGSFTNPGRRRCLSSCPAVLKAAARELALINEMDLSTQFLATKAVSSDRSYTQGLVEKYVMYLLQYPFILPVKGS